MPSITLKNVPEALLEALRRVAREERRSVNQEAIVLLERGLSEWGSPRERARAQVQRWRALAGRWRSEVDPEAETAKIYEARSEGRDVDL